MDPLLASIDEALAERMALLAGGNDDERVLQTTYGYYDDDGVRQGGLIAFVRYFWSVLEPSNPFVDGWPLWAMCEHLEAVTAGKIKHLLINVPPGFMKSMLTDVYWPAWEWAIGRRHYRYVCFSYSAHITMRDNDRFRRLITSKRYRELYPDVATRNETVVQVMNTATGWKLASSIGGITMGERGDRVIIDDPHNVAQAESERSERRSPSGFARACRRA
jgi:hypothetical protein